MVYCSPFSIFRITTIVSTRNPAYIYYRQGRVFGIIKKVTMGPSRVLQSCILTFIVSCVASQQFDLMQVREIYLAHMLDNVGQNSTIQLTDVEQYFMKHGIKWADKSTIDNCIDENSTIDAPCLLEKVSVCLVVACTMSARKGECLFGGS